MTPTMGGQARVWWESIRILSVDSCPVQTLPEFPSSATRLSPATIDERTTSPGFLRTRRPG